MIIATAASTLVPHTGSSGADNAAADNTAAVQRRTKRSELVYTFPVSGPSVFYPRDHLGYPAADLTGCRQLVRAPISGVIYAVRDVDKWDAKVD